MRGTDCSVEMTLLHVRWVFHNYLSLFFLYVNQNFLPTCFGGTFAFELLPQTPYSHSAWEVLVGSNDVEFFTKKALHVYII